MDLSSLVKEAQRQGTQECCAVWLIKEAGSVSLLLCPCMWHPSLRPPLGP